MFLINVLKRSFMTMSAADCKKFKGEIENYLRSDRENFDSEIDDVFSFLRIRTLLNRSNIVK